MTAQPPTPVRAIPLPDNELTGRVLRWLAIACVVVGAAQVLTALLTVAGWGFGWPPSRATAFLKVLYRLVVWLGLFAPALLLVGALGLLREKRWSRPVLTVYAFLQIAASFASTVYGLLWRGEMLPEWTATQHTVVIVGGISSNLLHCLLPAAIIVCLVRPGLVPYAAPADAAFQVLPPAEALTPPRPADQEPVIQ